MRDWKPGQPGRADLEHLYMARCRDTPPKPPRDTSVIPPKDTIVIPPKDTTVSHEIGHDSICAGLKHRLAAAAVGSAARKELEAKYKLVCLDPKPPVTVPTVNCDELRIKLAKPDPASADYARIKGSLAEHCPEKPLVK